MPTDDRSLPTGTVTFLRTDVQGSMALARALGAGWDELNAAHLRLLRAAVDGSGGRVVRTEGDALFAVFAEAGAAVRAAVDAQRALAAHAWPPEAAVRVRMGLHTGEAHLAGDDYGGFDVNRAARVAAAGHGGQILLSDTTESLVADMLPAGTRLEPLGAFVLRDVPRPERLTQLSVDGLASSFPPPRAAEAVAGDLPDRLTSFVGRERDVAAIVSILDEARLATITGPGGIGKTSLAIEVARALAPSYGDGAWLVRLATVSDPTEVASAIAHEIGLFDGPERAAATALLPYLADRSMILVLDNLEQVLEAADVVLDLVRASPRSRVIVTSRAPLHVTGEREVPIRPLDDEAVRLFTDRATAVRPGWTPGGDAPVIEEICTLLDDLPLGIELAAARVGLLSPTAIRDRLAARLPLPGAGVRDAPARQRTLEGAVAWSHDLLEPGLRTLLHDLGAFEGGFDAEQVAIVAGADDLGGIDPLDGLLELADRSLIVPVTDAGDRIRFRMLRTIQTFAIERLVAEGREADVRRRHAEAYVTLVRALAPDLETSRYASALDRIGPDIGNLRAATHWAIDVGDGELALQLVGRIWRYWQALGFTSEGRRITETALTMPAAPTTGVERAWAAGAAGSLAYWQADHDAARTWYDEQVRLARESGDPSVLADGLFNRAHVRFLDHEPEAAQLAGVDELVGLYRALGDERGETRMVFSQSLALLDWGHPDAGIVALQRGLAAFERLDDPRYHVIIGASLGWAYFAKGDIGRGARHVIDSLVEAQAMRDLGTSAISLHVGVLLAANLRRYEEGAVLHGAFDAACERYGVRPPAGLGRFIRDHDPFEVVRTNLSDEAWGAAYDRGRRLSIDEAVARVVALGDLVEPTASAQ